MRRNTPTAKLSSMLTTAPTRHRHTEYEKYPMEELFSKRTSSSLIKKNSFSILIGKILDTKTSKSEIKILS